MGYYTHDLETKAYIDTINPRFFVAQRLNESNGLVTSPLKAIIDLASYNPKRANVFLQAVVDFTSNKNRELEVMGGYEWYCNEVIANLIAHYFFDQPDEPFETSRQKMIAVARNAGLINPRTGVNRVSELIQGSRDDYIKYCESVDSRFSTPHGFLVLYKEYLYDQDLVTLALSS